MANTPTRMQQIRLALQAHSQGKKIREIARAVHLDRNTVRAYLRRCLRHEEDSKTLLSLSDEALSAIAYTPPAEKAVDGRLADFEQRLPGWLAELGKTGVTRHLLWQEYRQAKPEGYGYSQFCERLRAYARREDAVMHFEHKAGERLMIGFAGKTLSYRSPQTGELVPEALNNFTFLSLVL